MPTSTSPSPSIDALRERLPELMLRDRRRLGRRLDGARKIRKPEAREAVLAEISAAMDDSELTVTSRRESRPAISYPEQLPVSRKKDEILEAVRDHQVVIVAGETGSGKTTQIPKICMELGRGIHGVIGHTQPRRLAARTVAERVAHELRSPLGEAVGWKVRFTDQVGENTLVKLMTDGILLAEIQQDRDLLRYDTIIIDEAHERSLNIDFLLGYLAQLLPRRPELKVVITSATIDPERFSRHFGDAPIVEVSGRTYPVEVRYRPLLEADSDEKDRDQTTAVCDAVDELQAEGPGDILVFLSGEREIRDTADALEKRIAGRGRKGGAAGAAGGTEILPLYARLSHAEQHRVFQSHQGRRVVLATNVAETSLTVPGIKYVVDPGTARISRYSHRTKVQRLPIEPVSQASANQRKGRCGRTSDGICIRLYSEEDFLSRPEFTDAEILRTNLASVILQMTAAGLGDIEKFPFIDPPDHRSIKAGVQLLEELHAFGTSAASRASKDGGKRLTGTGRKLAQLPVDPRLARMVLEAERNGCVREVMVIVAALSIQDPRERPSDKQQQADQQHARFREEGSDFLAFLNLWRYVREQQKALSSSAFRRMCKAEFLNYLRIREWQDIYAQLRQVAKAMDILPAGSDREAPADAVHQSLLAGLLSHIGLKDTDKNEYLGARSAKFAVFPGSSLFKKQPRWLMSAELVETSRLWARVNAKVEPEWIEPLAEHLVKRTYSEPHWEQKQAAVMAYERVTLYGVPLVAQRKVNYGRIDPETCRDLFIRHALVEGDWRTHHRFFHDNRKLLDEVEELEHRARRRDILVDDETLYDFYDERVPGHVVSGAHFDAWWKKQRHEDADLLNFEKSMLINEQAEEISRSDYPDVWQQGDLTLRVTYQFEPGTDADGVTVHVPLQVLNQITPAGFDWQIPGLRESLVTELIRSLPKAVRRHYVPAPDFAARFLRVATPGQEPLTTAMARELRGMVGVPFEAGDFDPGKVPDHLKVTFRVTDERRRTLAESKDLEELQHRLRDKTQAAIARAFESSARAQRKGERERGAKSPSAQAPASGPGDAAPALSSRKGLTEWTIGSLPRVFETRPRASGGKGTVGSQPVKAYPALVDDGDSVSVHLFDTEAEQQQAMWRGTRRLILLNIPSDPAKFAASKLSNPQKLALSRSPHGSVQALFEDCVTAAADHLIAGHGGPAWDEEAFRKLFDAVRTDLVDATLKTVKQVQEVLAAWHSCEQRLRGVTSPALAESAEDVRRQLADLVCPGFVTRHGAARLPDLLRYLVAADRRLQQMPNNAERDRTRMAKVQEMQDEYLWLLEQFPRGRPVPQAALEIRWMIEELRVSYYAHALGTAYSVSDKRIMKAVDAAAP
ncbi:ATP-dependent RNA helicase HrpA [Streptomyces sp. WMMB 322]|uniref:ATP-dependent RNA helicase HrpA n=1 Tax=Streptomyces sp. WMMB 322 TaxID=1286821 RepID=UPI0006E24E25|nr:ATP-dependent RNA helicase HrpA [Streptomyces sp. WMMB 322]SCK38803.1 ATP-dependent helicase HrpA [Streptomyces sp. WMMB 322]